LIIIMHAPENYEVAPILKSFGKWKGAGGREENLFQKVSSLPPE
jgi:hypothetical protein